MELVQEKVKEVAGRVPNKEDILGKIREKVHYMKEEKKGEIILNAMLKQWRRKLTVQEMLMGGKVKEKD